MPTQPERNAETRRRLLHAARQAFADDGYAQASVADIVRRAGRSQGSFYLHFANKEAVLQALLEEKMVQLSLEAKMMWRRAEPCASVHRTVSRFIQEFGEDRDLWLLLDQRSSLEPAFRQLSEEWFKQLATSILRGMVSTETPGLPDGLDLEILAQVFAAMLSDSTRAAYQESQSWSTEQMAEAISAIWCQTLGYTDTARSAPRAATG